MLSICNCNCSQHGVYVIFSYGIALLEAPGTKINEWPYYKGQNNTDRVQFNSLATNSSQPKANHQRNKLLTRLARGFCFFSQPAQFPTRWTGTHAHTHTHTHAHIQRRIPNSVVLVGTPNCLTNFRVNFCQLLKVNNCGRSPSRRIIENKKWKQAKNCANSCTGVESGYCWWGLHPCH